MDGPEPTTEVFEYIATQDLVPVDNLDTEAEAIVEKLTSKNWQEVFHGLSTLRQLAKFNAESLDPKMEEILAAVLKSVKNPRSTLCKSGLMAAADIFTSCESAATVNLKDMLLQLLLKASQHKKFLSDEAEKALAAVARGFPAQAALQLLEPFCFHTNGRVRAKATATYELCVSSMTPEQMNGYGLPAMLKVAGKQISDQLPEARESARKLAQRIHSVHGELAAAGLLPRDTSTAVPVPAAEDPTPVDRAAVRGRVLQERSNGNRVPSVGVACANGHGVLYSNGPVKEAPLETAKLAPEQSEWERFLGSNLPALQCTAVLGLTR